MQIIDVDNPGSSINRNARRHLFLEILLIANTHDKTDGFELCKALCVSFQQGNTVFNNLLSFPSRDYNSYCWVQLLTFAATAPESIQLRHAILERMEKESNWHLPFVLLWM